MRKTITRFIFLVLVGLTQQSAATTDNPDCGRLKTGDTFDDINKILDCIESKISGESFVTATNVEVYSEEKEPNDLIGNANIISLGTTVNGNIKKGFDIFRFTAPESEKGVRIIIRQSHTSGFFPGLTIYDHTETKKKYIQGQRGETISFPVETEPGQDYYIYLKCRAACDADSNYELLVRAE
jgi:hypothetical protein